jgi:hypothetical protein
LFYFKVINLFPIFSFEHWQVMSLVSAAGRYLSSGSHFLTIAISPFPGVQSDAKAHAAEMGFIDVRISDSHDLEDGEYLPTPAPQVFPDLDDPYAIVPDPQRKPSSSTPLPARLPQVAPLSQYFLLMDINGVLLATYFGAIGKEKVNSMHTRVRNKLREFLLHCTSNFNVVFWTSMNTDNLERHFATFFSHAPKLGQDCSRFAQNWCDVSTYTVPNNKDRPFFLKRIARLLGDSMGLGGQGATAENTLLVDDTPYKNVLNDPYNAVHPLTFTHFTEKNSKKRPYLTYELWPFLKGLKESGLPVPVYCRQNSLFGSTRLFLGDEEFEHYKTVIPRDQRGFEVPYLGPHIPGAPYTNVSGPSVM